MHAIQHSHDCHQGLHPSCTCTTSIYSRGCWFAPSHDGLYSVPKQLQYFVMPTREPLHTVWLSVHNGAGNTRAFVEHRQGRALQGRALQGMAWQHTLSGSSTLALEDSRRAMHASRPSRSPSSLPLAARCKGVCPSYTQYTKLYAKTQGDPYCT